MSLPLSAVLGLLVGVLILGLSLVQLRDVDLYWHLRAGAELASGSPPNALGSDWTYGRLAEPWTSTQWLSELGLYWLHDAFGWAAMAGLRTVSMVLTVAILARTTLRGRPLPAALGPFLVASLAVWLHSQERPQQITFLGAALLGGVLLRGLTRGSLPKWWVAVPLTVLWANLHGGWVLVPGVLCLVTIGRWIDHGASDRPARSASILAAATLAAGAVSPAGLDNVTAVLRFSDAARDHIGEWGPTVPASLVGFLTVMMLALAVLGWTRRDAAVPNSEVVVVLALIVFAWSAWRNVTPGLLLTAPLVAERLTSAYPRLSQRREPHWSAPVGVLVATIITVIALTLLPGRAHLPTQRFPVGLASQISQLPSPQRVLNDYKVAGLVLYFGGKETQVGIDGRTDKYGAEYISRYTDTLAMKPGWQGELAALAPTSALIEASSGLAEYLKLRGWVEKGRESGYVLLVDPEAFAN